MEKLKNLLPKNKINEAISSSKSVKDFKFSKDELEFLQALINGVGSGQHPYADSRTISSFNMKYVDGLMKKVKNKVPSKFKSQYSSVLSKLGQMGEGLDDMHVAIPSKVERFLDRALSVVKSYNLPRKKEQLVIAKLVDALGMNPAELQQAVQKLKRYKIVKR